jgi:hypothetical protein
MVSSRLRKSDAGRRCAIGGCQDRFATSGLSRADAAQDDVNGTLTGEIARRHIFAIISHPEAGATTLTEELLLFGGAIQWRAK